MNQTQNNHSRSITDRFTSLFQGRTDCWGALHGECVKQKPVEKHYFSHLIGTVSLGIYPLLDNGTCTFGVVDIDRDDPELVLKIREALWSLGLKSIFIERSRSKGYHLWVFFSEPVKAKDVRWVLNSALQKIGVQVEVFPKQDSLREGEIGNYINLPYFGGAADTPERRVIVESNTFAPIPLEDFLNEAERSLVTPEVLYAILDELPPVPEEAAPTPLHTPAIADVDISSLLVIEKIKKLIQGNFRTGENRLIEVTNASGEKIASYPSRSEADEAIIASLLHKGYGDDVIFGVFEKYLTTGKYKEKGNKRHQYLTRSIANAKRFVEKRVGDVAVSSVSKADTNYSQKGSGIITPTPSAVLPDGRIVEMLYDPKKKETTYAVFKEGELRYEKTVPLSSGVTLVPYSPRNNLIKNDVVLFPSEAEDYGTEEELLGEIRKFIYGYVDLPRLFEQIACYYVLFTWIYDDFRELPYLRVIGDAGSGKTRFLETVGSLCYKPVFAAGSSTVSPLFRILDVFRGTLIIDEGDFGVSDEKADIVKILNQGNTPKFPVLRSEAVSATKREFNPYSFSVYGPKVISTRNFFDDKALESRCITEEMGQRKLREDVPINLTDEHERRACRLRNKLLMFRFRNLGKRRIIPSLVDRDIEPRLNQIFVPLLSVIDDEKARQDLRDVARQYHKQMIADRGMETEAQVLEVMQKLSQIKEEPSMKEISDSFIVERGMDYERRITPKWVGGIIRKKLKIRPEKREKGFVIPLSEAEKLTRLYEKYGLLDKESPRRDAPVAEDSTPF